MEPSFLSNQPFDRAERKGAVLDFDLPFFDLTLDGAVRALRFALRV
jgi:hypothetical protein